MISHIFLGLGHFKGKDRLISGGIFLLVPSSEKYAKSLSLLNFLPYFIEKLRDDSDSAHLRIKPPLRKHPLRLRWLNHGRCFYFDPVPKRMCEITIPNFFAFDWKVDYMYWFCTFFENGTKVRIPTKVKQGVGLSHLQT